MRPKCPSLVHKILGPSLDVPSNFVLASPFGSQGSIEFSRALQTRIASRIGMFTRFWPQKPSPITDGSCAVAWSSQYSALFLFLSFSFSLVWSDAKGASLRKKKGLLQMEGGIVHSGQTAHWFFEKLPTSRGHTSFHSPFLPSFLPSCSFCLLVDRYASKESFYSVYSCKAVAGRCLSLSLSAHSTWLFLRSPFVIQLSNNMLWRTITNAICIMCMHKSINSQPGDTSLPKLFVFWF